MKGTIKSLSPITQKMPQLQLLEDPQGFRSRQVDHLVPHQITGDSQSTYYKQN